MQPPLLGGGGGVRSVRIAIYNIDVAQNWLNWVPTVGGIEIWWMNVNKFCQICSTIVYLLKKNVCHRDLKLENLLLDQSRVILYVRVSGI